MTTVDIRSIEDLGTFADVVAGSSPAMRAIARSLRALVSRVAPGVTEVSWRRMRIASYGVGPKKMSQHYCYIAPQTRHVNLGFYYGAELTDPKGLLEGVGKHLRHVKVRTIAEAEAPALVDMIKRARGHLPRLK